MYNAFADYDSAGNVVSYNDTYQYSYDPLNTMTEAAGTGGHEIYVYTADDERVAAVSVSGTQLGSGTITGWRWSLRGLNNEVLRVFTKSGSSWAWVEDYVYRDGQMLAAEVATFERTLHFHADHLGTSRLITGNGGAMVAKHTYHPFGTEITNASQDSERKKFTAHERDWQLDYMHARYYNPGPGRFLSVDPILDTKRAMHSPQTWNRYSYVQNNPINRVDPDGRYDAMFSGLAQSVGASNLDMSDDDYREVLNARAAMGVGASLAAVAMVVAPEALFTLAVRYPRVFGFLLSGGVAATGGPGAWRSVNESMSARAAAYQVQVGGRAGQAYFLNGVKFDAFRGGTLIDGKGPGYATFVKNGQFVSWFKGANALVAQAQRQIAAAGGAKIQWHVAEEATARAIQQLLERNRISGIEVIYAAAR